MRKQVQTVYVLSEAELQEAIENYITEMKTVSGKAIVSLESLDASEAEVLVSEPWIEED